MWPRLVAEHERSRAAPSRPYGPVRPRWRRGPELARALTNRIPYLDPLNHLQVALLRRWRAGERGRVVEQGIKLTLNGLATGLRNSG